MAEANRLKLPIIAMVDTNCNPQLIDWPVPSNDDAIRAVRLIAGKVADAIVEGRELRAAVMGDVRARAAAWKTRRSKRCRPSCP